MTNTTFKMKVAGRFTPEEGSFVDVTEVGRWTEEADGDKLAVHKLAVTLDDGFEVELWRREGEGDFWTDGPTGMSWTEV